MALHPKQNSETTSLKGMVSRALGSRPPRKPDDPVSDLHEILSNLGVSEPLNTQQRAIDPVDLVETASTAPASERRDAGTTTADLEAHRQRLQQILENARQIEELLTQEAAHAHALGENLMLDDKRTAVAEAAEAERRAAAEAQAIAKNGETAIIYQAKMDADLIAAQRELAAAEASVMDLQSRLRDAQALVVGSKSKVIECNAKSKEAAKRVALAKGVVHDAECRVAKWREAREAAEAEVRQAEEIMNSIARTAETLKRIRALGNGELL